MLNVLFFPSLMVDRLLSQDVYVVDMKVGLCYEYSTDCDTVLILHKSKIPILSCDLTLDFIDRGKLVYPTDVTIRLPLECVVKYTEG